MRVTSSLSERFEGVRALVAAAIAALALLGAACAPFTSAQSGMAVVTGGITPCNALPSPAGPHFAAGTVTVLRGKPYISGNQNRLPTEVVMQQEIGQNQTYRLSLKPGDYVLQAEFRPVNAVQPNVEPFTAVSLHAGQTLNRDIPNMCI